jgi:hypothetical protein
MPICASFQNHPTRKPLARLPLIAFGFIEAELFDEDVLAQTRGEIRA